MCVRGSSYGRTIIWTPRSWRPGAYSSSDTGSSPPLRLRTSCEPNSTPSVGFKEFSRPAVDVSTHGERGERYGALSTLVRASARPGLRPQTTSPAEPAVDDFEFLVTPRKYGLERDM